jgi:plasmid maintenance system antidote protein VapI
MDTDRGLQEAISRNVRVLMAVHDIREQQDLAARLGWAPARINKLLNGSQRWAINDLPALARVFGVSPGSLLGDTADLVNAAAHPAVAGEVRRSVRGA